MIILFFIFSWVMVYFCLANCVFFVLCICCFICIQVWYSFNGNDDDQEPNKALRHLSPMKWCSFPLLGYFNALAGQIYAAILKPLARVVKMVMGSEYGGKMSNTTPFAAYVYLLLNPHNLLDALL